ncbi:MAG TPA: hypothetical protein VNA44_02775, partial [Burkholderiaceae bacterium]|nr:hypothetical protein [Burkholderiaceae bacterium]
MTDEDRDSSGKMIDRYRQASAELDERPSASLRASIVAAAAREVGARPLSFDAPRRIRPRWPLAAAAAVMLSTLTVMMAIRTNEEMPQFNAPTEVARSPADSAAASAPAAPITEPREAINQQAPERQRAPAQERSGARLKKESSSVAQSPREVDRPALTEVPVSKGLKRDLDSVDQAARSVSPPVPTEAPATARVDRTKSSDTSAELEKSQRTLRSVAAPAPPASEPSARAKLRAEQSAAGATAQSPTNEQARSDSRRDAAKPAAPAPLPAAQEERKQTDESAAAWLERIIRLRREGRHDEAEAELKRFRERYPQVQPPSEAL